MKHHMMRCSARVQTEIGMTLAESEIMTSQEAKEQYQMGDMRNLSVPSLKSGKFLWRESQHVKQAVRVVKTRSHNNKLA